MTSVMSLIDNVSQGPSLMLRVHEFLTTRHLLQLFHIQQLWWIFGSYNSNVVANYLVVINGLHLHLEDTNIMFFQYHSEVFQLISTLSFKLYIATYINLHIIILGDDLPELN